MGLDLHTLRFVMDAWENGADFSEVATLGRQHINVSRETYVKEAARYGVPTDSASVEDAFSEYPFCDGIMRQLGARTPYSIDGSEFEGATHVADMNEALPTEMSGRFTTMIDGGALEHIFDVKQTFRNVGAMLVTGGHFLSINVANNFMGHGFYQFSPELFFRAFSRENGFEIEEMILTETNDDGIWYDVIDPAVAGRRVQLVNNSKTYIMMRARKIADVEMFTKAPQQSDYQEIAWKKETQDEELPFLKRPWYQRAVENYLPRPGRIALRRLRQSSRKHFASPDLRPRPPFS